MPAFAPITIHQSQWPETLARQLRECLQQGQINPKFHYESPRQVRQWLRLHEACSPARRAADVQATYDFAFASAARLVGKAGVHLIGLGCGGGQKEAALLKCLAAGGCPVMFSATDVSSGMVVTTLQAAWQHIAPTRCSGLVCDLTETQDLDEFLDPQTPQGAQRVITFFGMIPNFEPEVMRVVLQRVVRPGDLLLYSANLAPGPDYRRGVQKVLPQYDNEITRSWLELLLADVGLTPRDGEVGFAIEEAPVGSGWLRITAALEFAQASQARVEGEVINFEAGTKLRLFFSYRHTVETLQQLFAASSLALQGSWISDSGEEGVFLAAVKGA